MADWRESARKILDNNTGENSVSGTVAKPSTLKDAKSKEWRKSAKKILDNDGYVVPEKRLYSLKLSNGLDFGTVSYDAMKAIENNTLNSYKPKNDAEKKTIADFSLYATKMAEKQKTDEKQKRINSNPTFKRYNIDPESFSRDDFEKWATEHGFEYRMGGNDLTGNEYKWLPKAKSSLKFWEVVPSKEEQADKKVLETLAENNQRKLALKTDKGIIASTVLGAIDGLTFGAIEAYADWDAKRDYKKAGLDADNFVSYKQANSKTVNEHKVANAIGNVAGSAVSLGILGKGVSAATKGIKWIAKTPQWVQSAINSGITFSVASGAETAFDGGDLKETLTNAGINFVGGAVGGAAGDAVSSIGEKILFNKNLQHKIIPEIVRNGLSSASFAGGKSLSTYFLYPKGYRPTAEEMTKDIGVAFAFGAVSSGLNTMKASVQNKKYLDSLYQKMASDYESMAKANISDKKNTAGIRKFAKNVVGYSNAMEAYLTGKEFNATIDGNAYIFTPNKVRLVGQDKYVNTILSELQTIRNNANAVLNGIGTPTVDLTTTTSARGGATTPAVVPTLPNSGVSKDGVNAPVPPIVSPHTTRISAASTQPATSAVPNVDTNSPVAATSATSELDEIMSAEGITKFSSKSESDEIKRLENILIAKGADDTSRKEIVGAALEVEDALMGSDKIIRSVFNNVSKITSGAITEIKNKVGVSSAYWKLFRENFKAIPSGNVTGNIELITEYANAYTEALKNNNPEKYNSVIVSADDTDLSAELPQTIMQNEIPASVQNAGAYRLVAAQIKNIVSDVAAQISSERAEIFGTKTDTTPDSAEVVSADIASTEPKNITLTKVGDFYEAYGSEAAELAKKLNLTPTTKNINGENVQMVGFPVQAFDSYEQMLGNEYTLSVSNQNSKELAASSVKVFGNNSVVTTNDNNAEIGTNEVVADKSMYDIMGELGLTYDEQRAILKYKSSGSYTFNEKLRNSGKLTAEQLEQKEHLNSALDKFPKYKEIVYRNIGFKDKKAFNKFIREHSEKAVTYIAFTSCSKTVDGYRVTDAPYLAHYDIESLSGRDVSSVGVTEEQEILYKTDTSFEIISIEVSGNTVNLKLKEIGSNGKGKLEGTLGNRRERRSSGGNGSETEYTGNIEKLYSTSDSVRGRSSAYDEVYNGASDSDRRRAGSRSKSQDLGSDAKTGNDGERARPLSGISDSTETENGNTAGKNTIEPTESVINTADILSEKKIRSKKTNELFKKLTDSIPLLQNDAIVYSATGNEFEVGEKKLSQQVYEYFESLGGVVHRENFGDVAINDNGVDSSIAHGMGRAKAIAFASVPAVIEKGRQIDYVENWKGRNYDSYVFAAPIRIGTQRAFVGVVVTKSDTDNRYYLHEVSDNEGNIIIIKKDDVSFKSKSEATDDSSSLGETSPTNSVAQDDKIVNSAERNTENAANLTDKCELIATKHTATGNDIWVVSLKDKITSDEYKALNAAVKKVGGYYSRFAKTPEGKAIPGFVFKAEPTAKELKVFNDFFGYTEKAAPAENKSGIKEIDVDALSGAVENANHGDEIKLSDYEKQISTEQALNNQPESAKIEENTDRRIVKDVESQSGILDRESKPNGGRLHARASKTAEQETTEKNNGQHRKNSRETLSQSTDTIGNRPDVRDDSKGVHGRNDAEDVVSEASGNKTELTEEAPETIETEDRSIEKKRPSNKNNFIITDDIAVEFDNTRPSAEDNIAAIELLLSLENEGRPATAEEKKILAKYKGWGGIDTRNVSWEIRQKMLNLFNGEQLRNMQTSTTNAFFTPTGVIDAMYNGLKRMGFKGGNVLETSMGVGNFFGRMPSAMSAKSALTGVELESYTARIAQFLYPGATVINKPFQDVAIRNDSFDMVIGNVPFGNEKIRYGKKSYALHNYFIISSLDKVRDGGVVAVITSAGTLDSYGIDARKAIMDRADVVACYKLPAGVFSRNASTDVQTDLLILRKRADGAKPVGDSILNVTTNADGLRLNEYFVKNPKNILGTLAGGTNAWGEITTVLDDGNFYDKLNKAMSKLPKGLISGNIDLKPIETIVAISSKPRFFEKDGKIYANDGAGTATAIANGIKSQIVRDYMAIRDAYKELLAAYSNSETVKNADGTYSVKEIPDADIKSLRETLSKAYNSFAKKHGAITGDGKKKLNFKTNTNRDNTFLEADADYYLVSGLEKYNTKAKQIEKSELFERDTLKKKKITSVDTASDALIVSLNESGKVDFARMRELTGKTEKQLANELKGEIVLTPDGDYVLTDVYLSGNIYEKLEKVKGKPEFKQQQEMLERVIPTPKDASSINIKLGANYIDTEYVEQFSREVFHERISVSKNSVGAWMIDGSGKSRYGDILNVKYGCEKFNAIQLLEKVLNDGEITATDTVKKNGISVSVYNPKTTEIARQKAEDIKAAFENWIFRDSERRTAIVNKYNRMYNNYRPLDFARIAEKLSFESMNEDLRAKLYPHQKKGIARALFGGNVLFAHGVGTGKTFEMIASVMEAKRMGIINKTAMVVPNNKVVDFKNDIAQAYPNAKVLVIDTANKKRQTMLGLVNSNDWDIVLIGKNTFTKIPVGAELQANYINEQVEELDKQITEAQFDRNTSKREMSRLTKLRDNLLRKLETLNSDTNRDENGIEFEKLGFDCICVDEAHNYKSIITPSRLNIKGLSKDSSSQQANDMLMKLDYMRSIDGKIIFGTGTPITNTVSEIYNMMRMVRPDILEDAGIHSLDEWVNTFANIETQTEVGIDGKIKNKSTQIIKSFFNATEMIGMYRQFADVVFTDDVVRDLPDIEFIPVEIEGTEVHRAVQQAISNAIDTAKGSEALSVYGKVMTMGSAAALDTRMLAGADSEYNPFKDYSVEELEYENSKVNVMCNYVFDNYKSFADIKGTQLIFCDGGAGTGDVYSFNVHKDIRQKLIKLGIPENEIVIMKNQNDAQLEDLYAKVNSGEVRVLIGTSAKMAEGLNVQERVVAIHYPTVTYNPADLEQSMARGRRKGNINKKVKIYRYLQGNTFDSYKWQALERKGEMINRALRGEAVDELEDVNSDIDPATAMAITSGNPLVKEKIDTDKEVKRLKVLKQNYMNEHYRYEDAVAKNPGQIKQLTEYAQRIEQDIMLRDKYSDKAVILIKGKTFEKQSDANKALSEAVKTAPKNGKYTKLGTYNGFDIAFKGDTGGMGYSLILKDANEYSVEYAGSGNNIARIAGVLNRLDTELQRVQNRVETLKKDLEFAKQEVKKPFEKEKELTEVLAKQKDITYRYEHYGEKTDKDEDVENAKYSIIESEDFAYEQTGNDLLSRNGKRKLDESAGKQAKRVSSYRKKLEGKSQAERKETAEELAVKGYTEEVINGNHKYTLIKEEGYNDDMRSIVSEAKAYGKEVGFFVGNAIRKFDGQRKFKIDGIKLSDNKILIRYDGVSSPQTMFMHELVHSEWNNTKMQRATDIILSDLSENDKEKILQSSRYKSYMALYNGNEEAVWEEFIADVFAGMNDCTANYIDIVTNYWNGDEIINSYNPSQYNKIADAGGKSAEVVENSGISDDYISLKGEDLNGSENAEALERNGVYGNDDSLWQQGDGSDKNYGRLERVKGTARINLEKQRGFVDWGGALQSNSTASPRAQECNTGILRKISKRRLTDFDTVGRALSAEVKKYFANTVFKNKDGELIPMFHATDNQFNTFKFGDFGFHVGSAEQAINRGGKYIKELYANITNPLYIPADRGIWTSLVVANEAKNQGVITQREYNIISTMEGFHKKDYNSRANTSLRNLLKARGYDGIVYPNGFEGEGISAIAFDTNQLKYVSNRAPSKAPDIRYALNIIDNDIEKLTPERKKEILEQFDKNCVESLKPTQKQLWGERAAWVAHNMTRVFPNIPERGEKGTFFAEFRKYMIQWKNLPNTASLMAQDKLNKMTEGLTPNEFKTFSELVYFLDLQEEAQIQKDKGYTEILLPNEITPAEVDEIVKELESESTEAVKRALTKRRNIWEELKTQYIDLNNYIGFETDGKFKRKNYYHHQVIDYMNDGGKNTGSREMGIKAGRGWLKERHGSAKAINTNFLLVEHKALLQMQYDVYVANMLGKIKGQYDIKPKLEKEALANNKKAIAEIIRKEATDENGNISTDKKGNPDSETFKRQKWYNSHIKFGFDGLIDLAERNELPTCDGEYAKVVEALKRHDLNVPGLYKYVATLANMKLPDNATDAQEQAVSSAGTVLKYTTQKRVWIKEKLGNSYQTWETIAKTMSDTHTIHQPRRGNYLYTKNVIDEDAFNEAHNKMVLALASGEVDLGNVEINKLFAQYADTVRLTGAAYEQWVLPKEIVDTMNEVANPKAVNAGSQIARIIMSAWKSWVTTLNPLRTIKFAKRNLVGDLDAVIAGNPKITLYSKRAVREIYQAMRYKKYSPEFMEWVERGGYTSMLFANEMDAEMQDKLFSHLKDKQGVDIFEILKNPMKLVFKYKDTVENVHNFREAILRYSAYLYFREAIKRNGGTVKDYVSSNRYIVRGLHSVEDKAYQLSKDLLGAYDEVGRMGQTLRRYHVPFYSFTETNAKRYYRLFENIIASDDKIPQKAGKFLLKALMVNMLGLLMVAWNKLVMKDEDDKLPPTARNVPHVTLGKIGDNIYVFRQLGSFSELLEWVGLEDYKWSKEDITAPLDKAWGMVTPFLKMPIELVSGLSFYPSLTQPRSIRDKWQHFFNSLGVDELYNEFTGKPTRGWDEVLKNAVIYNYDYKESAYYEILDIKREYQSKTDNTIYGTDAKSNALYYMKTAVRYKDEKAALKYLDKYFESGGTVKGIKKSFTALNPMYGFTGEKAAEKGEAFIASLSKEEKEKLKIAQDYYENELMLPENVLYRLGKKDITDEEAKNLLRNYINAKCK